MIIRVWAANLFVTFVIRVDLRDDDAADKNKGCVIARVRFNALTQLFAGRAAGKQEGHYEEGFHGLTGSKRKSIRQSCCAFGIAS